jgi:hypothetical protein
VNPYDGAVAIPSDADFRSLVDERGIVRAGAIVSPARAEAFTVFAQRTDARVEAATWERHATQFFDARVGLVVEKRYGDEEPPLVDAARVVVAPSAAPPGTRFCFGRPREADDLEAAERADALAGSPGLGLLAKRCEHVWLVATESADDRIALLLAAILASVVLGPILAPDGEAIFGVRTARARLEAPRATYR